MRGRCEALTDAVLLSVRETSTKSESRREFLPSPPTYASIPTPSFLDLFPDFVLLSLREMAIVSQMSRRNFQPKDAVKSLRNTF